MPTVKKVLSVVSLPIVLCLLIGVGDRTTLENVATVIGAIYPLMEQVDRRKIN